MPCFGSVVAGVQRVALLVRWQVGRNCFPNFFLDEQSSIGSLGKTLSLFPIEWNRMRIINHNGCSRRSGRKGVRTRAPISATGSSGRVSGFLVGKLFDGQNLESTFLNHC